MDEQRKFWESWADRIADFYLKLAALPDDSIKADLTVRFQAQVLTKLVQTTAMPKTMTDDAWIYEVTGFAQSLNQKRIKGLPVTNLTLGYQDIMLQHRRVGPEPAVQVF